MIIYNIANDIANNTLIDIRLSILVIIIDKNNSLIARDYSYNYIYIYFIYK